MVKTCKPFAIRPVPFTIPFATAISFRIPLLTFCFAVPMNSSTARHIVSAGYDSVLFGRDLSERVSVCQEGLVYSN